LGRVGSEQADCNPIATREADYVGGLTPPRLHRRKSTNYIGGSPFGSGSPQLGETLAAPLVEAGWVDRFDDELADDEAVTEAFGEGTIAYRFSDALVERFKRAAAENAMGAGLN
jgi:hypothetical protein